MLRIRVASALFVVAVSTSATADDPPATFTVTMLCNQGVCLAPGARSLADHGEGAFEVEIVHLDHGGRFKVRLEGDAATFETLAAYAGGSLVYDPWFDPPRAVEPGQPALPSEPSTPPTIGEPQPDVCPDCAYGHDTELDVSGVGSGFPAGSKSRDFHVDILPPDSEPDPSPEPPPGPEAEPKLGGPDVLIVAAAAETSAIGRGEGNDDVVLVGTDDEFHCSGVLIAPRHVLTARHCLPATRIAIGADHRSAVPVGVTGSASHAELDAAVLTLEREVNVPVRARRHDATPPSGTVRLVGYGVQDPITMRGFGERRRVDVPVDGWGCTARRARKVGCDRDAELLLVDRRGNDTCYGDSGGAVLAEIAGEWQLLAITSRPTRQARRACGEGGIYVRLDVIGAWIDEVLAANRSVR